AASQDDQMVGTSLQVQRLDMGHRFGFSQTGSVGYCCVGSDVHEHAVSGERAFGPITQCDVKGARGDECAVAEDEFVSRRLIFVPMTLDNGVDHSTLARIYSCHVDGDRSGLDPELPMPPHEGGDLR